MQNLVAANKQYVDSRKTIIAVWATATHRLRSGRRQFHFGAGAKNNMQAGYVMSVSSRILRGGVSIAYPSGATMLDVNTDLVSIYINTTITDRHLHTGTNVFDVPLELAQGDILSFISVANIPDIGSATVNVLIELDL